jgi:hypothetical protein
MILVAHSSVLAIAGEPFQFQCAKKLRSIGAQFSQAFIY